MSSIANNNAGSNGNGSTPRRSTNPLLKRLKASAQKSKATNAVMVFHVKPNAVVPPEQDEGFKPKEGFAVTVDGYFGKAMTEFWFLQKQGNDATEATRKAVKDAVDDLGCVKWNFQLTNPNNGQIMRGTNGFPLKGFVWFFEDDDIAKAFDKESIKDIVMNTVIPTICSFRSIEPKSYPVWDELQSYRVVDTWSAFLATDGDGQLPQLWKMTMVGNGKTYGNYGAMLKASKNFLYGFLKSSDLTKAFLERYAIGREHLMTADADKFFPPTLVQQMTQNNNAASLATSNNGNGTPPQNNNNVTPSLSQQNVTEEETPAQPRRLDYNEEEKTNDEQE